MSFSDALGRVSAGQDLSMAEMTDVVDRIMRGECREEEIALLLTALRTKGEAVSEIAGAAAAMRRHMTQIRSRRTGLLDTCGTGGDGSGTFNISTAAAIVVAAAGVPVAKHGNRSITSRSGSADVLAELGVNVQASVPQVERCLDELGLCFCFAPLMHGAMKHVAPVRKALPFPTIFNLLGPLANPAGAAFQVIGVGKAHLRPMLAEALSLLGAQRAIVVHGTDGIDEVTLGGTTEVSELNGETRREFTWQPGDFGLKIAGRESMLIDGPAQSAAIISRVLAGEVGPSRDIVVLNAAAALWVGGKVNDPAEGTKLAQTAIDSGEARGLLTKLSEVSHA